MNNEIKPSVETEPSMSYSAISFPFRTTLSSVGLAALVIAGSGPMAEAGHTKLFLKNASAGSKTSGDIQLEGTISSSWADNIVLQQLTETDWKLLEEIKRVGLEMAERSAELDADIREIMGRYRKASYL